MNIIVTGASRGIGKELVKDFASRGGNRVLALSRNLSPLEKLAVKCNLDFPSSEVHFAFIDLADKEFLKQDWIKEVSWLANAPDILVNNAGLLVNKPFGDLGIEELEQMVRVNYLSPALLIRELLPHMGKNGRGHIVNISSMGGVQGSVKFPGLSGYSASKAALAILTECLAEEFKSLNVSFNCLALGAVQTEMLQEAFPGYRAPVKPADMAKWMADFCLKGMHYCNGKILPFSLSTP